jgi:hypothetical protein
MNVFLFQLNFYYFRISFFLLLFSVLRAPSLFRKILGLLSYFPLFVSPSSQDLSLSESPRRNNAIIVPSKVLLSSSVFPLILFRLYEILLYRKKTILSHSNLTYLLTYLLTPWCRTLFEKLIVTHLVKKYPFYMEPESSLPRSKSPPLDPILIQPDPVRPIEPYLHKV